MIMRQNQKMLCSDVTVLRSADCWTDHKLLRARLRLKTPTKPAKSKTRRRYDVAALRDENVREEYNKCVRESIVREWKTEENGIRKWEIMRDGMMTAAERVLGWESRRQPDWFQENVTTLKQLITKRNQLFSQWLKTHHHSDRQRYVAQRRAVAKMKGTSGRGVWQGLREIQRGRAGLKPVKPKAIRNRDGQLCEDEEESLQCWRNHFEAVLNVKSTFVESAIQSAHQYPLREDMNEPPTAVEISEALDSLKGHKAGGKNGILPELVKSSGGDIMDYILDLFNTVWNDQRVPDEWRDAMLVPIPKKGDLTQCDNWRGISLLDVVGKLFAKVIQKRLQRVVEDALPDSQCGFRSGRGCIDMIFCTRQLVEKAREHNTKVYLLFVDLRKAYDSVPREALWVMLRKYSIPPVMVKLLQSLHDGMQAEVTIDGYVTPEIEVQNGLRQGCTIAPTLFNLYFNLVIESWRQRCQTFGVDVLYKCNGKLVGERTRRPSTMTVTALLFADDAAAVSTTREDIERAAHVLDEVTSEWGLRMNMPKTKLMVAGVQCEEDLRPIYIKGETIEAVKEFKYLGAIIEPHGGIERDEQDRIARASRAFGALSKPVFHDNDLSLLTKRLVYRAVVLGVLLYGAETWANKRVNTRKFETFHNRCLRSILGITKERQRTGHISSVQVGSQFGMEESLEDTITARRLRWLGHLARMDDSRIPKKILFGWLPQCRPAHGTKLRWRDRVRQDLKKFNISEGNWFHVAQERGPWRAICREGLEACTKKRVEMDKSKHSAAARQEDMTTPSANYTCGTCQRSFRRRQDIARHKCQTTRPRGGVRHGGNPVSSVCHFVAERHHP